MIQEVASEYSKPLKYVENLISLYQEGNSVPFISRYRKENTGGMTAEEVREIIDRYDYLVNLEKRKSEVISLIEEQGKLTGELKKGILNAKTLKEVEDIYAPYKSKRKTKADLAIEAGLQPFADWIKSSEDISALMAEAEKYINEAVADADAAVSMASDIIAQEISHDIDIKTRLREIYGETGIMKSEKRKEVKERTSFEDYYDFEESAKTIKPHRILGLFRGEKEKVLKIKIHPDEEKCFGAISLIIQNKGMVLNSAVVSCMRSAFKKSLELSLELEMRAHLKELAEIKAISVFSENLKSLLLTPTVRGKRILGMDPAFRTGCKLAVIDETGKVLDYGVIYPTAPQMDIEKSRRVVVELIKKYTLNAIAIGNGTASRETEEFVADMISECGLNIEYAIVNEAGASVYSASELAAREFPEYDVTIRGAISIARRVVDPLAELVKIDPQSIGVGMYQHDVNQKKLGETLTAVVEDVVNDVGVDLNTASPALLQYISGLSYNLAEKIVKFRETAGRFMNRKQLLDVDGIGEKVFRQCAGFLKIYGGEEPLDSMFIHPENYSNVHSLLKKAGLGTDASSLKSALLLKKYGNIAKELGIGEFTFEDIVDSLVKPDRDIRDNLDPVVFKKGVVNINDLKPGMMLDGKVTNVIDFGAFVDIGLKNDGLVHISQLADRFVKDPKDVVKVGSQVKVRVLDVDHERGRVSLSMKSLN